jgi:hypothetical protein
MTDAPVDLDELERIARAADRRGHMMGIPTETTLALISELHAARATPPADPAVLGHIGSCMGCFFAELELLDALRDGAEAGEPAEKLLKRVTAVLRDERRPACPAPPADEVAGPQAHLERGARIAFNHLDYRTANRRPLSGGEAAWLEAERARIENHLKGKR